MRPTPSVRWNSEQKQRFRSTGSANTNPNDATNNPTVSGSPEDRDDHQLNSGEKEKKCNFQLLKSYPYPIHDKSSKQRFEFLHPP